MFLIVGTGLIAEEYMKCLIEFNIKYEILGNTTTKSDIISEKYNCVCYSGGVEKFNFDKEYDNVIIATPAHLLYNHLKLCILKCKGLKNVFIEKPGCLYTYELKDVISIKQDIQVFIALNRRFYSSVLKGKEIILNDPIKKLNLIFNEYNLMVCQKMFSNEIMQTWFSHMTKHIVDLAFFLTGIPDKLNVLNIDGYGQLGYYKKACIVNGNGITKNNIEFEYSSNWTKNGKWKMELQLESGRILSYQPLEDLKIINIDGTEELIKRNEIDIIYKPGYYKQINSFITNKENLLTIENHYSNQQIFHKMVGQTPDYNNILLIGCGNIGFRHLNAFSNTNLPLNMHIIELSDDNIKKANNYLKNYNNINVNFYKDVNEITEAYFDICTIATCSDVRLMLVKNIIKNDKIKYISNMVLEKFTFQSMQQFKEYDELITKFKNCNTFISSHARYVYDTDILDLFTNPKIDVSGGNWGLLCNSVHFIIYILYFITDFTLDFKQNSDIIDSKRNNFKEIYGRLYNDNINISCSDKDENICITFTENQHKLVIEVDNIVTFFHYENDILVSEFTKKFLHTSVYFESEYKNLLLHKETNLCKYDKGLLAHKIFFDAIKNLFNTELLPIT